MAATLYVDGATGAVLTVEPNLTGKSLVEISAPEGIGFGIVFQSLASLQSILNIGGDQVDSMIVKFVVGE